MRKLLFRGPVQTASGYGVHARMLLKALVDSGEYDITVASVPWGSTPLIYSEEGFFKTIRELSLKFDPDCRDYDLSVQVSIPNEFQKIAPVNIGVTAGIEVDRVAPEWIQICNDVIDVLVVPSVHSAETFTKTIYHDPNGKQIKIQKPIYIMPEWPDPEAFNQGPIDPTTKQYVFPSKFNFLVVGLGMDKAEGEDRKNITQTVRWFCEQFRGDPDVGLVLKVSLVNNSFLDFKHIKNRIQFIKQQTGCGQFPRIHLIHGRMSDRELAALYKNTNIKALITLTHGEGYGLPIIEAAACGLPVMATNWSGHLDFLKINGQNKFVPFDYELKEIPDSAVWDKVLNRNTRWANPVEADVKMKMKKITISYDRPKEWADELAVHINVNYTQKLADEFLSLLKDHLDGNRHVIFNKHALVKLVPASRKLDNVTLVAVSDKNVTGTVNAMVKSMEQIGFADAILFTSKKFLDPENVDPRIRIVQIDPITSVEDYDQFIVKKLADHIKTSHVLTVQWDGYVLNGSAWDDEFLKYDYIGAPWFWDKVVGNSGFSLRSVRLAKELQGDEYFQTYPQDVSICRMYRQGLEGKGFKFAPYELAHRFSVENEPHMGQFGWHGLSPFSGEKIEN
jgi:glycosyltransferase involved in cell wall biosynthesis